MPEQITLVVFPGGFNWPVWVAQERRIFAKNAIEVRAIATPGSVFQWTAMAHNEADLAITLFDNVIAYREGQGEPGVDVPDAVALMAADVRSLPSLITSRNVESYADLGGRALAVDSLRTGNALVLMGMLERGGLRPGEYELVQAGGVSQRFEGLRRGDYAGSLFNAPFDRLLRAEGFPVLDTASNLLPHFQGQVVAARQGWADAHRWAVTAFARSFVEAITWLYDPANHSEAFALYAHNVPDGSPDAATTAYGVLFDRHTGFPPDAALDEDGMRRVIALRQRFGTPARPLHAAATYVDTSFLTDVLAERPAQ